MRVPLASRFVERLRAGDDDLCIVTYGTSLTAGGAWVQQVDDVLARQHAGQVAVINSGKGASWSQWGVENLSERVLEQQPDLLFIEFAINDAYLPYATSLGVSRLNLEYMLDRVAAAQPQCDIVVMTMNPPVDRHLEARPEIERYYQQYGQIANERQLPLLDLHPAWCRMRDEQPDLFATCVPDGIHPAAQGSELVTTPAVLETLRID